MVKAEGLATWADPKTPGAAGAGGIGGPGAVCLTGSMMTSLKAELILKWPRIPPDEEQDPVVPSRSDPDPDDIEQFSTDSVALAVG